MTPIKLCRKNEGSKPHSLMAASPISSGTRRQIKVYITTIFSNTYP
ncbi:hypothetical protein [Geobacillus kaustophilus]|nr:hypothetical protein [Geobacillus kaustophilus]